MITAQIREEKEMRAKNTSIYDETFKLATLNLSTFAVYCCVHEKVRRHPFRCFQVFKPN